MSLPPEKSLLPPKEEVIVREDDNLELQRFSIGDDDQNEEQAPGEEETFTQKLHRRRCRYLPSFITKTFKGSVAIAFLSHACFITASLFYVKLSFVLLAWVQDETVNEHVPKEVLGEDDDIVWSDWASGNENGAAIQDMRENYYRQYKFLYVMGAFFFVLVGVLDLMRYCDVMNVFMILAGATGMAAGLASTSHEAAIWELVSVHLYLMEAYNLVTREHEYEGHVCFRLSDVCFLIGSILDVLGSYFALAGFEGILAYYMDLVACFLWLACSLIDFSAEIYYLEKHKLEGHVLWCY